MDAGIRQGEAIAGPCSITGTLPSLADVLIEREAGIRAFLYASGMSAITRFFDVLSPGIDPADEVLHLPKPGRTKELDRFRAPSSWQKTDAWPSNRKMLP